jgi:hypothetical protein
MDWAAAPAASAAASGEHEVLPASSEPAPATSGESGGSPWLEPNAVSADEGQGRHRPRARRPLEEAEGELFQKASRTDEAAEPPAAAPPAAAPPAAAPPVVEVGAKDEDSQPKKRGWWQRFTE